MMGEVYFEDEIALFARGMVDSSLHGRLFGETLCFDVLDSGCSKNVCSERWLNEYVATLDDGLRREITFEPSEARFRFGDGTVFTSRKKAVIPAEIKTFIF